MPDPDRWSRRRLLTARGLGASTGGAIAALMPEIVAIAGQDDRTISHWQITRRAMACDFTLFLPEWVREPLALANAAFAEIEQLEDILTVYRADSEMCRVNRHAAERPVRTDARLFSLLQRAAALTGETRGAFDVSTGAMIKAWGFFQGPRRVPAPEEHADALRHCGMHHVELNEADLSVRYRLDGLEINLGSIGKGYAIDHAVRRLRRDCGLECGLITGGSSSIYGMGSPWDDGRGWLIGIEDPADPSRTVATVRLKDRALGTSSGSNQHFECNGKRYTHLLDPRTGWPAEQVASASALATDAATADALATAFFVMGLDKTAEFCQNHPDIAAIIVLNDHAENRRAAGDSSLGTSPGDRKPGGTGPTAAGNGSAPRIVTFNLSATDANIGRDTPVPGPHQG